MWINLGMTQSIMLLDMIKLCRIFKCRNIPIQMPQPLMYPGISRPNIPNVALEVLYVDRIEADNCHE